MILVIAGRGTARAIRHLLGGPARHDLPAGNVSVLDPAGLSAPGWVHDPADPRGDRIVIDGEAFPASRLATVITAIDEVSPGDVPHVRTADRQFVAAEMTAFLRSWLATLACPVVDPPTTLALSGRASDREAWSAAAAAAGVTDRLAFPARGTRVSTVTVVAGRIAGPRPATGLASAALAVTAAAGVTGARLTFTDDTSVPALRGAVPWWYAPGPCALRALLAHAQERASAMARRAP